MATPNMPEKVGHIVGTAAYGLTKTAAKTGAGIVQNLWDGVKETVAKIGQEIKNP